MTNDNLCDHIRHCRISCAQDRKVLKIHVEAKDTNIQPQLLDSLRQLGAEVKRGSPPKSRQERLMQILLDSLENF